MENAVIVVASAECGRSPVMPYVRKRTVGTECAERLKKQVMLAALRCGFDVVEVAAPVREPQDVTLPANRYAADAAVVLSYTTFGSCKSFNDVNGCVAHCSPGRFYSQSRTLCEDICAFMTPHKPTSVEHDGILSGASCPTAIIDAGYLTCYDEARLAMDPDDLAFCAEHIVMGLCENFGMPYLLRDDPAAYPTIAGSCSGKRGAKIKLVQTALDLNGYECATDGIFGKTTELKLKAFCINNGIAERGITEEFWNCALLLRKRRVGPSGKTAEHRYIAQKLRAKLYCDGTADTAALLAALNEFLSDSGKPPLKPNDCIDGEIFELISKVGGGKPRLF